MAISNSSIAATPTNTTVYTSSGNTAIITLIFCNTSLYNAGTPTANTTNLTVYAVPTGNAVGTSNMIINALPIPAGETFTFDTEKMVLSQGDSIVAIATAANLTATISYMSV
jgi:hypothetical protein